MRIIFLGSPGVGKGTQAHKIAQRYHIPQISTGDMLRNAIEADTPVGRQAHVLMEKGELVPDAIMIALVKDRIAKSDCARGFLLDGFPRTIAQAQALTEQGIAMDYVIELRLDDETIVQRLSGRRVHIPSGRIYHVLYQPPKVANCDDETGEPLIQRADDQEETIRQRLAVYQAKTVPLIDYYRQLAENGSIRYLSIDASGTADEVEARIVGEL